MDAGSQTNIDPTESGYFEFRDEAKLELESIQNDIVRLMKNLASLVPEDECDSDEYSDEEATSAAIKCLEENKASTSNKDSDKNAIGEESATLKWDFLVKSFISDLHKFKHLDNETNDVVRRIYNIEESGEDSESSREKSAQS